MIDAMHYQLEQTSDCATFYLGGGLARHDALALEAVCEALPPGIRTLRLDLRSIGSLSAEGLYVVRRVLHFWSASRGGEFRLSTSHLMATYRPAQPTVRPLLQSTWPAFDEALTGTYL